jgi:hypothetical protein
VYRRDDGRVVGEYTDANGRKRYITSKTKTKAEMKAAVRKALEDRDNGIAHDSENLTVEMYVERWLESTRDTVGLRTYQRSEETARLHIVPAVGKVKLDKLTAMQLDELYRKKLEAGLSPRSVQIRSCHRVQGFEAGRKVAVGAVQRRGTRHPAEVGRTRYAAPNQGPNAKALENGQANTTETLLPLRAGDYYGCKAWRTTGLRPYQRRP